jgi:AraC family transcriptional regulator
MRESPWAGSDYITPPKSRNNIFCNRPASSKIVPDPETQPGEGAFLSVEYFMLQRLPAGQFFGRQSKSFETGGFRLTESVYSQGLRLPLHSHELAKFCFVISGDYVETLGRKEHARRPLTLTYHPPDTTHAETHRAPGHHFLVELDTRWLEYARDYSVTLDTPVEVRDGLPIRTITQLYREFRHFDAVSTLAIQGLMFELLAETSRSSAPRLKQAPPWLHEVTEVLHEQFSETLSLAELAQTAGVHAVHLARAFRKFHQCTVGEYVRRLRVEFASQKLSLTDTPLAEIASMAGFADQSHFSRTFKRSTGLLPTEFRNAFRAR